MSVVGTHRGPFRFACPRCFAGPGKPCRHVEGPRTGQTRGVHGERRARFRSATHTEREAVVWTNAVETNPRRH